MKFINLKVIVVITIFLFPSFIQAQMLTGRVTDGQSQPVPYEEGIIDNDDSKMNESLTATFAEYVYEIGKIKLQAGLRFENTAFGYYKSGILQKEQSKDYSNLFPSISIYIPVGNIQTQLSYTSDITRPGYQMLRSRTDYVNRYTYESGNPLLQPSITQNFAITGTYKWWQLYADFQHNKNGIVFSSETYSEENANIALMRQVNIPSYNAINVMLEAAPTIGCWSPQFIFELYKQWYTVPQPGANSNLSLNKPAYATRWRNAIELPLQFTFSADFNWEGITEQTCLINLSGGLMQTCIKICLTGV